MFSPKQTRAIVTGHSRGLGEGISKALLDMGVEVLGLSRQQAPWAASNSVGLKEVTVDLSNTAALLDSLAHPTVQHFCLEANHLLLINNAGLVGPIGPIGSVSSQNIAQSVALNVTAPLVLANELAKLGKPLRVLHISSGAGRSAYAGWGVYCATKAALDHHARAHQLDGLAHVQVVSLAPGVIDTDMQNQLRNTDKSAFPALDRFIELKKTGQLSSPTDAGQAVANYCFSNAFGLQEVVDIRQL